MEFAIKFAIPLNWNFVPPELILRELKTYLEIEMSLKKVFYISRYVLSYLDISSEGQSSNSMERAWYENGYRQEILKHSYILNYTNRLRKAYRWHQCGTQAMTFTQRSNSRLKSQKLEPTKVYRFYREALLDVQTLTTEKLQYPRSSIYVARRLVTKVFINDVSENKFLSYCVVNDSYFFSELI